MPNLGQPALIFTTGDAKRALFSLVQVSIAVSGPGPLNGNKLLILVVPADLCDGRRVQSGQHVWESEIRSFLVVEQS